MAQKTSPQFKTLTDRARFYTGGLMARVGGQLHALGIHPDLLTFLGLVIVAAAAYVAAQGHFFWAGIILILGSPVDALDGAVARAMKREDQFGALWDSTLDRYADGFIFMGLVYYYSDWGDLNGVLLSLLALLGSQVVPYVRARAEGLDVECKIGILSRMERMVIIVLMLLTGWVTLGLWILVIGTHITVAQRVWHVYRALKQSQGDHAE
jgi:CDP-diacylglycerol--glycerol-3-phosphate 3-phosphatidyltransferase